ncbi:hypothetical protein LCGC14_0593480 [marine sediment metagenome]|uniref:Uncharacterized protein n=1 Tax=marine sediment metagenome TaxID=412755 RepID=A0A0F9RCW5_9ZZZZ
MYEGKQKLQKSITLRVYKDRNTITQVSATSTLGYGPNYSKTFYITKKHQYFGIIFSIFNTLENLLGFLG